MKRVAAVFPLTVLLVALTTGVAQAQSAPAVAPLMITLDIPATPPPASVTLDPKTTAVIVLDFVAGICNAQPTCTRQMLPSAVTFLDRARQAGLPVLYGTREQNMNQWRPEVAPRAGDIRIISQAQDRFFNTDLDQQLKARGIKTLILLGWKVSGSVTYTAVGAMARDYTVVVPVDTTAAATGYETIIGFYNLLNSGTANLTNEALRPRAVTLSRSDLVRFQ